MEPTLSHNDDKFTYLALPSGLYYHLNDEQTHFSIDQLAV